MLPRCRHCHALKAGHFLTLCVEVGQYVIYAETHPPPPSSLCWLAQAPLHSPSVRSARLLYSVTGRVRSRGKVVTCRGHGRRHMRSPLDPFPLSHDHSPPVSWVMIIPQLSPVPHLSVPCPPTPDWTGSTEPIRTFAPHPAPCPAFICPLVHPPSIPWPPSCWPPFSCTIAPLQLYKAPLQLYQSPHSAVPKPTHRTRIVAAALLHISAACIQYCGSPCEWVVGVLGPPAGSDTA